LYNVPEGKATIEVFFEEETFWLSQKKMSELFNVTVKTISEHLQNIFITSELEKDSVIRNFRTTAVDGKNYDTQFYNLDAIIAVGYRVNSMEATRFRIWATKTLREFIIKGFVLDDERLKQGKNFGKDYFEELLERIREIRASERRFYQKITDIYAQCSIDYDPLSDITLVFYKTVQNKLHWAVTGRTAAENYQEEKEINELNRVVGMYLDYAENQARRNIAMSMADWVQKLDAFLQFNDYHTLKNAGTISHDIAKKLAEEQYDQYRIVQDQKFESDFDKLAKKLPQSGNKEEGQ
jgi:hypothetical protein